MSTEENILRGKVVCEESFDYKKLFEIMDKEDLGFINAKNIKLNDLPSDILVKSKKVIFEIF